MTPERINSSIQRAWVLLEGLHKRSGQTVNINSTFNVSGEANHTEIADRIQAVAKAAGQRSRIDL